jgi:hypothetical protein
MQQEPRQTPQPEEAKDLKELYSDAMRIDSGLFTSTLTFGDLRRSKPPLHRVRIRVSPHMLKAVSLLTAKHVREFEEKTGGSILLPNDLLHGWGLEEEIG